MWTEYTIPTDLLPTDLPATVSVSLAIRLDDTPIDGNASAWGDDETDAEYADAIRDQIARGNDWAWALVRIRVTDGDAEGESLCGGVSYWWTDEAPNDAAIVRAFMLDYGSDMIREALEDFHADADRLRAKYAAC